MPTVALANHGPATISVKVSDTSVRQTKLDHSGCSPARIGPTSTHFTAVVTSAATSPAASITTPETTAVHPTPTPSTRPAKASRTPSPIAQVVSTASSRHASHTARATRSPSVGR